MGMIKGSAHYKKKYDYRIDPVINDPYYRRIKRTFYSL
jgi:hypothetical protein